MATVDIIIVNYKVPLFVEQALRSLESAARYCSFEIWLVDNDSGDNSIKYLQERFPKVHFIENNHNGGFAEANNLAIRASKSPYVLLLNPDTMIGESTLPDCLEVMERHPDYGAVGGKLLNAKGEFLPECHRGSVSLWSSFCRVSKLTSRFPKSRLFNGYYKGYLDENKPANVNILCGAFMFMRRKVLEEIGLLDERYFMYGEDVDLSYAIRRAGYKIYYIPSPILHYKGESESAAYDPLRYSQAFYGAISLFYEKYHPYRVLSKRIIHQFMKRKIQNAKKNPPKSPKEQTTGKNISNNHVKIDIRDVAHLPSDLPPGSYVVVQPSEGYYDRLLSLLSEIYEHQATLITYYPEASTKGLQPGIPLVKGILLAPGGLIHK